MINRWYVVAFLALCGVASAYAQSALIPQNWVWAGPASGGPGFASGRALVAADLPNGGAPQGAAGGGLAGTYPNPTVATVPASALPAPTVSTLGGVKSKAVVTHNFLTQIGTDGSVLQAQPACGDLSNAGAGCASAAPTAVGTAAVGQVPGTATNDSASAGNVGEESDTSVVATTVSLSTTVANNLVSKSLAVGDYEISGNCTFAGGATTAVNYAQCGFNTTSGVLPAEPNFSSFFLSGQTPFGTITRITELPPTQRFSFAATTTVFLVANASFATSTLTGGGLIHVRRVR